MRRAPVAMTPRPRTLPGWLLVAGAGLGLAAPGCAAAVDPAKLAAVQIAGAEVTLRGCRLLGPLEGKDSDRWVPGGPRLETAMLDLRKKAVLGGGNTLVTDSIEPPRESDYVPTFVVRAKLYACSTDATASVTASVTSSPAAAASAAVSPAALCEPECSPGYTCLRGACVSACNPRCGAGERCGGDRICHPVAAVPSVAP